MLRWHGISFLRMRILADPSSVYVIAIYPAAILNFQKKNSCGEIWEKIVPPRRWFNSSSVAARKEIKRHSIQSRFQKPSSGWAFRSEHAQFETKRPLSLIRTLKSEFKFTFQEFALGARAIRGFRFQLCQKTPVLQSKTFKWLKSLKTDNIDEWHNWACTYRVSDESGTLEITPVTAMPLRKEHLDSNVSLMLWYGFFLCNKLKCRMRALKGKSLSPKYLRYNFYPTVKRYSMRNCFGFYNVLGIFFHSRQLRNLS